MAGVSIRVSDASFTYAVASLTLPNIDNLAAEYTLGVDGPTSIRNRANPSAPATVVGAPTYTTYQANISGGGFGDSGFNTGITPTGDVTIIAICSAPGSTQYMAFGQFVSNQSILGLLVSTSDIQFGNSQWASPPSLASLALPTHGNKFFIAGVGVLGATPKLYLGNAGALTSNTGTQPGPGTRNTTTPLYIGTTTTGYGSVTYAALFNRALTQSEVLAVYTSLKSFYTGKVVVA